MGMSAAIMMGAGTAISAMGSINSGRMSKLAGERAQARAQFQTQEAEYQAGQVIAESQLAAAEQRRQGELVASRSLAVAAASGAGVSDPTVVNVIANTKGEAVYRANVALYEGAAKARQLRIAGAFDALSGQEAALQGRIAESEGKVAAIGSLAKGAGSATMYAKYGMSSWNSTGRGDSNLIDAGTPSSTPVG